MKKLASLILLFAFANATHGALLLEENFNGLTVGNLGGQNGWTAVAGVNVTAGGQNYSNGSITINGGANRVESNLLSTGVGAPLATHQGKRIKNAGKINTNKMYKLE